MKNLKTLANELATNKMTLLVTNQMLNVRGGCGCNGGTNKVKSTKIKSVKTKSIKIKSVRGNACGW